MAKNRDPAPQHECTSEEEESGSESESESESEREPTPPPTKGRSKPATTQTPQPQKPHEKSEDSDSGSGSESDESSDDEAPSQPEPVVQKPASVKKPTTTQTSSSKVTTPATKVAGVKRAAETNGQSVKDAKKGKTKNDTLAETGSKRSNFQRIWSDDDEIVLLSGMLDYMEEKKADPYVEITSFHDSIRERLQVTVNKDQLRSKMRALKRRFTNNQSKEVDGEDRVFSKPHEHLAYQLSKKIWGKASMETSVGSLCPKLPQQPLIRKEKSVSEHSNGVIPVEVADAVKTGADGDTLRKFSNLRSNSGGARDMEEMILKIGRELFEGGKVVEGSKVWKNLELQQMEIYLETLQIKTEQTRLVLDGLKSQNL